MMLMKYNYRYLLILLFIIILLSTNSFCSDITITDKFITLQLSGSPYEIGYEHGRKLKTQINMIHKEYYKLINEWAKFYLMMKNIKKPPKQYLLEVAKKMEKFIPKRYILEMKGIAEGAEVPYEDILIMNIQCDFFANLCSSFGVMNNLTKSHSLIIGRNVDWGYGLGKELDKYTTIFFYKPDDGYQFVTISYPGMIGVISSMNNQKLITILNYSMCKDNCYEGIPITILLREITQFSKNIEEAKDKIINAKRTAGFNILMGEAKEKDNAIIMEVTATKYAIRKPTNNRIITTNHFVSDELKGTNIELSVPMPGIIDTKIRYERLEELIEENQGRIDVKLVGEFLQDYFVKQISTVQSIVFLPDSLSFLIKIRGMEDYIKFTFHLK